MSIAPLFLTRNKLNSPPPPRADRKSNQNQTLDSRQTPHVNPKLDSRPSPNTPLHPEKKKKANINPSPAQPRLEKAQRLRGRQHLHGLWRFGSFRPQEPVQHQLQQGKPPAVRNGPIAGSKGGGSHLPVVAVLQLTLHLCAVAPAVLILAVLSF